MTCDLRTSSSLEIPCSSLTSACRNSRNRLKVRGQCSAREQEIIAHQSVRISVLSRDSFVVDPVMSGHLAAEHR